MLSHFVSTILLILINKGIVQNFGMFICFLAESEMRGLSCLCVRLMELDPEGR